MKRAGKFSRVAAVVAAAALVLPTPALAQAVKAGVVTTLQGSVTVARQSATSPLKFKDEVFVHDRIVTGDQSIARILLGGKAVVTVRERSELTISETPTTSTIEIGAGRVALAVAKDRMRPGDSVEIKTPNAVAGIRGTVIVAEVSNTGSSGVTSRFTLLTGIVDVTRIDGSGRAIGQSVILRPLQSIGITGAQALGTPRGISKREAQSIASDYKVTLPDPPASANTQVTERQVEQAVDDAAKVAKANADKERGATKDEKAKDDKSGKDDTKDDRSAKDDKKDDKDKTSLAGTTDDKSKKNDRDDNTTSRADKGGDKGADRGGDKGRSGGGDSGRDVARNDGGGAGRGNDGGSAGRGNDGGNVGRKAPGPTIGRDPGGNDGPRIGGDDVRGRDRNRNNKKPR